MALQVALHHETVYRYDRSVSLGPQVIRLRPAPHCRTRILSYSLRVIPKRHFLHWQQDPQGNFLARLVLREPTRELRVVVDLVAEMAALNPLDFFLEESAERWPFEYEPWLAEELEPFLRSETPGPRLRAWLEKVDRTLTSTVEHVSSLNRRLQQDIEHVIRTEPGVQTPEETLELARGSCRDSAWLLAQILRRLGIAARFTSGYLIQLAPDVHSLERPSGPKQDRCDLHAWAEAYLPGAGWVGLDPTSGLFAGEGHLPLASSPKPQTAAPLTGTVDACEVELSHRTSLRRTLEPQLRGPNSAQSD
jgi:transglutaminase-like putative cysteine protease